MTASLPPASLIEQATIPLVGRSTAECCDLAVLYYGRLLRPLLRLYLSLAVPAVCLVFGMQQFVGGGFSLLVAMLLLFSKPLGLLTVAGAARTTFRRTFDQHVPWGSQRVNSSNRLGRLTASMLSSGSLLAITALVLATIDDAFGPGRVAQLGPIGATLFVLVSTGLLLAHAAFIHWRDYAISPALRRTFFSHLFLRVLAILPLGLTWLIDEPVVPYLIGTLWLPIVCLFLLSRYYRAELVALTDIEATIFQRDAERPLKRRTEVFLAFLVFLCGVLLLFVFILGFDILLRTLGANIGLLDPLWDGMDGEADNLGVVLERLFHFPRFGAAVMAIGLFVYQLGRLALYFLFLDARIRYDCWDMELLLAREARRIEEAL